MKKKDLDFYRRLMTALAGHFGPSCELVLFDLSAKDPEHAIAAIENGQVTGRKTGDALSHVVLEAMKNGDSKALEDRIAYSTSTADGKLLKSSTIYLRDENGKAIGILAINSDITLSVAVEQAIRAFNETREEDREPEPITHSVADLLDTLIAESIRRAGKPVSMMTKADKVAAVRFLNDNGAFLITRSGPKVCETFGISKYTLYSYLDEAKST